MQDNLEGIFLELKLRKRKVLLFGGYNYDNIDIFLGKISQIINRNISELEVFILLEDFNSQIHETCLSNFCATYNLKNHIHEPTYFKKPTKPSTIDLILTNREKGFQNSKAIETGLSDQHKMTVTVMKYFIPKQSPKLINYRNYKHFDNNIFRNDLRPALSVLDDNPDYNSFEITFMEKLNKHAPMKEKYVRANNAHLYE